MIMQPDLVTTEVYEDAWARAAKKKSLAAISKVRLESLTEGLVAQITHIGPYAAEGPTIQRLHAFIAERGFERRGKHHEIYLSPTAGCSGEDEDHPSPAGRDTAYNRNEPRGHRRGSAVGS
jgi:hypothetical protein